MTLILVEPCGGRARRDDVYYDPYDFAIDVDPYPVWRRLREEAPLYYNEQHDFFALSRFDDVEHGLGDWRTYSSAKGSPLSFRSGSSPRLSTTHLRPPCTIAHRSRSCPRSSLELARPVDSDGARYPRGPSACSWARTASTGSADHSADGEPA